MTGKYSCRCTIFHKNKNKIEELQILGFGLSVRNSVLKRNWGFNDKVLFSHDNNSIVFNLNIDNLIGSDSFRDSDFDDNTIFSIIPYIYIHYTEQETENPEDYNCTITYEIVEGQYNDDNFPIIHIPSFVKLEDGKDVNLAFRYVHKNNEKDYYDYLKVDTINKTVKYIQNTQQFICNGEETIVFSDSIHNNSINRYYMTSHPMGINAFTGNKKGYCSHLAVTDNFYSATEAIMYGAEEDMFIYFFLNSERCQNAEAVKDWLRTEYDNGTPVTIVSPYKETIDDITNTPIG